MDNDPVLWCKDLRKRFKERLAVDGVGFEVAPGETYGLLGPNGAGKTTTISMICGLLRRDGGEVTVAGASLDHDPGQVKAAIGYVPQDVALYPDLSGLENLRFWGRMYGLAGRDLAERVEATLEVVGLTERAGDKVAAYSGGTQRRLNIAAGLLHRPRLLVLDEPTVGVDPQSRNAILENVEALGGEGVAVLYTTRYMEEAERLCDRVGIIDQGRLIAEGTRRELVAADDLIGLAAVQSDGSVFPPSMPYHFEFTGIGYYTTTGAYHRWTSFRYRVDDAVTGLGTRNNVNIRVLEGSIARMDMDSPDNRVPASGTPSSPSSARSTPWRPAATTPWSSRPSSTAPTAPTHAASSTPRTSSGSPAAAPSVIRRRGGGWRRGPGRRRAGCGRRPASWSRCRPGRWR